MWHRTLSVHVSKISMPKINIQIYLSQTCKCIAIFFSHFVLHTTTFFHFSRKIMLILFFRIFFFFIQYLEVISLWVPLPLIWKRINWKMKWHIENARPAECSECIIFEQKYSDWPKFDFHNSGRRYSTSFVISFWLCTCTSSKWNFFFWAVAAMYWCCTVP